MEILYLLIPLSLLLVGVIIWVFLWAVRSGQFDDLEGPAHQILMDDDSPVIETQDEAPPECSKPPEQ
jgi:cbb3-type cytochrome oxidase maturation protein